MTHATITITRWFQECAVQVAAECTGHDADNSRYPGEVEVDPEAEGWGPFGRFKATLTEAEMGEAKSAIMDTFGSRRRWR